MDEREEDPGPARQVARHRPGHDLETFVDVPTGDQGGTQGEVGAGTPVAEHQVGIGLGPRRPNVAADSMSSIASAPKAANIHTTVLPKGWMSSEAIRSKSPIGSSTSPISTCRTTTTGCPRGHALGLTGATIDCTDDGRLAQAG